MVQLWSAVALFLCLTLPSVSCADAGESSYKNGHCPQPGQGVGSATEDDSQQMRCCSESGLMNGVAVHTFQYCTSPGCCGERGYLMCCNWDKFRVYLAVGLTLGTLAILGSCFGICTCLLRANGLSCADVCDICLDTYGGTDAGEKIGLVVSRSEGLTDPD